MAERKLTIEKTARIKLKHIKVFNNLEIDVPTLLKLISIYNLKNIEKETIEATLHIFYEQYYDKLQTNSFLILNAQFPTISKEKFISVCLEDNSNFVKALIQQYYNFSIYEKIFKDLKDDREISTQNIDEYKNDKGFKAIKFKQAEKNILKKYNDIVAKYKY